MQHSSQLQPVRHNQPGALVAAWLRPYAHCCTHTASGLSLSLLLPANSHSHIFTERTRCSSLCLYSMSQPQPTLSLT